MGWVFTDEMRFYLHDNETLLDGMMRTEHKTLRYECRQGYCGACRMNLVTNTGAIRYVRTPIATLGEDEILACCCMLDGTVKVSYDPKNDAQPSLFPEGINELKTQQSKHQK